MAIYTSPTKKAQICRDKAAGMTNTAVTQKFGLHRTTVQRIFERYAKSEDYYVLKQKPGRPRLFTKLDTRFAVHTLAAGKAQDVSELQRAHFPNINADVENPGISYSDILILIPDSRTVYDLIFTLFILLTLSR